MLPTMARKRGKPKSDGGEADRHAHPRFAFHLERELLDAVGRYCLAQRLVPDKSEVVRLAVREFLEREGFWPPASS